MRVLYDQLYDPWSVVGFLLLPSKKPTELYVSASENSKWLIQIELKNSSKTFAHSQQVLLFYVLI